MKQLAFFILLIIAGCSVKNHSKFQNGDIIFHTSTSRQSEAIQIATNSEYSHMGIVYLEDEKYYVFEAVQPVKVTPLDEWINRGKNHKYVVKRLKNAQQILTKEALQKMKNEGEKFNNRNYDLYFEWSDENIYCSELVWKIYKRALNIELGKLKTLSSFNLEHPAVQQKLKERYGNKLPMDELVISPKDIFNSDKLVTVYNK
jgi:uncharacterized protein YycO